MVFQLKNTDAKLLFVHPDLIEMGIAAAAQAGIPKDHVYLFSEKYHATADGVKDWREMVGTENEGQDWKWKDLSPAQSKSQVATVNYSSGTTGLPKGVCVSHRNLIANTSQLASTTNFLPSERWVGFLPLYHAYGQTFMILMAITKQIPVIVMKAFEFESYLQIIQDHAITRLQTVPPILIMLSKRPEVKKYDLSSVKEILCGAAPCSKELQESIIEKFGLKVVQGWGSTETTCAVCFHREGCGIPSGSVGLILPNTEIKLINDEGREVGLLGTPGEAYVRGPQMALGYWRNEEASRDSFEVDGWYKTGDVVVADEKGFFYIVDRKKVRLI
jgi:4-coumarate--CoA ligase